MFNFYYFYAFFIFAYLSIAPHGRAQLLVLRRRLLLALRQGDIETVNQELPRCHGLNWAILPTSNQNLANSGNPLQVLLVQGGSLSFPVKYQLLELLLNHGANPLFQCPQLSFTPPPHCSTKSCHWRRAFSFSLIEDSERQRAVWTNRSSSFPFYDSIDSLSIDNPLFFSDHTLDYLDLMQDFFPQV